MARNITGDTDPELIELARRIAEAHVDVIRVRQARGKVWHAYFCPENRPDLNSARKLTVGSDLAISSATSAGHCPDENSQSMPSMMRAQKDRSGNTKIPYIVLD
jgi:hypothetical protein